MDAVYRNLIPALWAAWGIYWWIMARNVKSTTREETRVSRALHIVPLVIAASLLLSPPLPIPILNSYFLRSTFLTFFLGTGIVAFGLAFAIWARWTIGRNWSGTVTLKQGHELIRSGPYRWVRHPIYTGLLLGFLGSAIALGEWRGLLALLIVFVALWRKLRLEERWMEEVFGDQYIRYRVEVSALIPFIL
jgi:protein-S-isoprenylcysteine O-methyltransferase Ste14